MQRAFEVVRVLRRSPTSLTLTSIAQSVGIAASTAHSILNDLLDEGAVQLDEHKRYRLGPSMFYLGSAFSRAAPAYRSTWVELVAFANEFDITASVAVPWDGHHLTLGSHQGGSAGVNVATGGLVPLDAGSWGKAYFAWSDATAPKALTQFTDQTITDAGAYAEQLEQTRQLGYAIDRGEFSSGIGGVATSVTSARGYEGLVSLLAPLPMMEELSFERLGERLASLASRASLTLGDLQRVHTLGQI